MLNYRNLFGNYTSIFVIHVNVPRPYNSSAVLRPTIYLVPPVPLSLLLIEYCIPYAFNGLHTTMKRFSSESELCSTVAPYRQEPSLTTPAKINLFSRPTPMCFRYRLPLPLTWPLYSLDYCTFCLFFTTYALNLLSHLSYKAFRTTHFS